MFKIQIQSQMLLEDTQYFQYCNTVELRAVQYTSTRFLTIAYFNNKDYKSTHKSLQSVAFFNHIWNYERNNLHCCHFSVYELHVL